MESYSDLIKLIKRYQAGILRVDPPESDPSRVLHYIRKLSKLPIKLQELEETGIGKTVNSLRKHSGNIAEEATLLVVKWKSIVKKQVEEEEALEEKYTDDSHTDYSDSPESETGNDREYDEKLPQVQGSKKSKSDENYKTEVDSREHLITITKRDSVERKRKHSNEPYNEEEKEKYIKVKERKDETDGKNEVPNNIPRTVNQSVSNDNDSDRKKKIGKRDEKKHRKDNEKSHHKSSKHSHKDDERHRNRSKSSHREKKRSYKNIDSRKHKDKKSKSKRSSKECLEINSNERKSKFETNLEVPANPGDEFGAALLSIPNIASPIKKKSISSKSSTYQDSPATSSPSSRRSTIEMDLLSENVKLEPLELDDISFKIPNNTYSPPHDLCKVRHVKQNIKSEEDMFITMSTTKNKRTKVFSGNKVANIKFPTLFELCVRVLQENFDALEYTGGVPYDVLKPILEKVSVQQLYTFENHNPYLIGETDELWKYHAKKDFRKAERQEYETWRDLYLRCFEEREEKLQSLTVNISQSKANAAPQRKTKRVFLDTFVKPPRSVSRNQAKYGTGQVKTSPKESSPTANQSVKERLARESMSANTIQVSTKALVAKKKKAPLMQKTLQLMKGMKR